MNPLPLPPLPLPSFLRQLAPPAWVVEEVQQRIVLFLNHVLMQEPHAMQRLAYQQGRQALVQWHQFYFALEITPAGLLNLADLGSDSDSDSDSDSEPEPDLIVEIMDSNPLALAQNMLRGAKPSIRIQGDVQLAAEINWVAENVSWDVEEDLARVLGDAPAFALARAARSFTLALRRFAGVGVGAGK